MNTENFYKNLPSFSEFREIIQGNHFTKVPSDWFVIITDVKGSTKAINEGRYKDVNTIGVATISAIQNAIPGAELPFVFGGDGASFLIHGHYQEKIKALLLKLKILSIEKFNLELRAGLVPMSKLQELNRNIEVAKYEIRAGKSVSIFRGGGLAIADRLVKDEPDKFEITESSEESPLDLTGLSCRWQPIPSANGKILALLVTARTANPELTYKKILQKIYQLFDGDIALANPLNNSDMSYKSVVTCFIDEVRYLKSFLSFDTIKKLLGIIYAVLVFKYKLPPVFFDAKKYSSSIKTHSDYKKFDDALRMVVDCKEAHIKELQSFLETLRQNGEVFYGLHISDNALMTCLVKSLDEGQHIHFIDGDNGGYAMAAKQLKKQIRESVAPPCGQ